MREGRGSQQNDGQTLREIRGSVMSTGLTRISLQPRLLYSRKETAKLLGGISTATVRRLEAAGRLRGIRLSKSKSGSVFFRAEDIEKLLADVGEER